MGACNHNIIKKWEPAINLQSKEAGVVRWLARYVADRGGGQQMKPIKCKYKVQAADRSQHEKDIKYKICKYRVWNIEYQI